MANEFKVKNGLNVTTLTASKPVFTDANKNLISTGTLGVDQGGTGLSNLTANNVILGNGTSAVQTVAPGTAGNVLTSNGTTWVSSTPSAGSSVTVSTTPPASPTAGSLWYDTSIGVMFVYYNDGTSSQWVESASFLNRSVNLEISAFGATATDNSWDLNLDGGSSIYTNYQWGDIVDAGYGSDVTVIRFLNGGVSSTSYDVYGEAIDGGLSV